MNPASTHGATNVSPLQTGSLLHLSAEPTNALDDKTTDIALNAFAEMTSGGLQECASLNQKDVTQLSQPPKMGIDLGDDPLGTDEDYLLSKTDSSALTAASDSPATIAQKNLIGSADELLETSRKEVPPIINSTLIPSDQTQIALETALAADVQVISTPQERIKVSLDALSHLADPITALQVTAELIYEQSKSAVVVRAAIAVGLLDDTEVNKDINTLQTIVSTVLLQVEIAEEEIDVLISHELKRIAVPDSLQNLPGDTIIKFLKHHGIDNTYTIIFAKPEDIESFADELETFRPWLADFLEAQAQKYLEAKKEEAKKQQASEETTPQIRNNEHVPLSRPHAIAPPDNKTTSQADAVLTLAALSSPNIKGTQSRRQEESRAYEETRVRVNEEKRLTTKAKQIEEKRLNQEILKKEIVGLEFRRRAHFKQRM